MRKADIDKLAKRKRDEQPTKSPGGTIAPDAREAAQERVEREAVNLSRETINALADAVAGAIVTRLEVLLPICARLAAADTIHTVQKAETVLGDAIKEGLLAGGLIWEKK